jgi:hypothetical protein
MLAVMALNIFKTHLLARGKTAVISPQQSRAMPLNVTLLRPY